MIFLQEAMVAGPFMLIGLIAFIVLIAAGWYVWTLIVRNNNKVAEPDLTEEENLKFLKSKRTITFFWVTILLMIIIAIGSCVYKACTVRFG